MTATQEQLEEAARREDIERAMNATSEREQLSRFYADLTAFGHLLQDLLVQYSRLSESARELQKTSTDFD